MQYLRKRLGWKIHAIWIFALGFMAGSVTHFAEAQKPSQMEILYGITSQNFYLTQKVVAYSEYLKDLSLLTAEKNKVKIEQVVPLTNKLQQELFALDLKIKQINR